MLVRVRVRESEPEDFNKGGKVSNEDDEGRFCDVGFVVMQ
jgi:hypothetical protein